MIFILLILIVAGIIYLPQYWAKSVLKKYSVPRDDLQGTGGELVEHLRDKFSLDYLKLEATATGDHYSPVEKVVRLSEDNLNKKSLTAVAVAAHEFGHALQDAEDYKPLILRTKLVLMSMVAEKFGSISIFILPLLAFTPLGIRALPLLVIIIIASMGVSCLVHFITLPVEFDASFNRALPILKQGQYVDEQDLYAVKRILTACALTYLAGSLAGLLNFWRWIRFLRR